MGLEAYPAKMLTQPILPGTQRGRQFHRGPIRAVGTRQHNLALLMRNHLGRRV